jgi:hypothetical protein
MAKVKDDLYGSTSTKNKKAEITSRNSGSMGSLLKESAKGNTKILPATPNKSGTPTTKNAGTTPAKSAVQNSSASSYKSGTNVANERAYLESVAKQGGGSATWAKQQMAELDKYEKSQPASSYTPTASGSSYAPNTSKTPTAATTSNGKSIATSNTSSSKPSPYASNSKLATSERYPSASNMAQSYNTNQNGASYRNNSPIASPAMAAQQAAQMFAQQQAQQTARSTANLQGAPMANKLPVQGGTPPISELLPQQQPSGQTPAQPWSPTVMEWMRNQASQYTPSTQQTSASPYTPTGSSGAPAIGSSPSQSGQPVPGMEQQQPGQQPFGEMPAFQPPQMQQQNPWANMAPQQQIQQSAQSVGSIVDQMSAVGQQFAGQSNEHAAAVAAQYTQMVDLLDQLEAQIIGQIKGQMGGDDPGLQAALGVIKEEAARMRDASLEDLNARGLVQSGVYAEALDRLNKNELTSIQQTVAGQFSDLQSQLNNALMSLAQARIGALSGNQSQLNNMLISDRQTQANIGLQGIGYGLEERNQNMQNQQYYAGLGQQWNIANMQNSTDLYGMNLGAATDVYGKNVGAYTDIYKTNTDRDLTQQQINNNYAVGMANAKNSGGGNSSAMLNYGLDRDMFEYNKSQQQAAQIEGYYSQMSQELQGLTSNNQISPEQKRAMVSNSRYPDEVKQWALNQLNVLYPAQQQTQTQNNQSSRSLREIYTPTSFYGNGGVR